MTPAQKSCMEAVVTYGNITRQADGYWTVRDVSCRFSNKVVEKLKALNFLYTVPAFTNRLTFTSHYVRVHGGLIGWRCRQTWPLPINAGELFTDCHAMPEASLKCLEFRVNGNVLEAWKVKI